MARTDDVWVDEEGLDYIKPLRPSGYNILISGYNRYLNFNSVSGSSGYGFRDNSGVLEYKNSGDAWKTFSAGGLSNPVDHNSLSNLQGGTTNEYYHFSQNGSNMMKLSTPFNESYPGTYMEYTETGGNITQVNYYSDSGKLTKLFTKDITYTSGNPTLVAIKDEILNKTLTTTINWSGGIITNVTKIIT